MKSQFRHFPMPLLASISLLCAILTSPGHAQADSARPYILVQPQVNSVIKGWGIFPPYAETNPDHTWADRPAVQKAIGALGATFVRTELWQGFYKSGSTVSGIQFYHTNDPGPWPVGDSIDLLVRNLRIAHRIGIKTYILSSWSPPTSMKTLDSPTGSRAGVVPGHIWREGKDHRSFLRQDQEQTFCNWYAAALLYLKSQGVGLPVAISIQNEPTMWNIEYQGCFWEASQWRRVVKMMRHTLDSHGLQQVAIQGPDDTLPSVTTVEWNREPRPDGYLGYGGSALTNDPTLDRALPSFAFHSYDLGFQDGAVKAIADHPREIWMTEFCDEAKADVPNPSEQDLLLRSARHLAADFHVMPINYWSWFGVWGLKPDANRSNTLLSGDNPPHFNAKGLFFKRLWNTVRPGWTAHRVMTGIQELAPKPNQYGAWNDTNVSMIAFASPHADKSVLLIVNPMQSALRNVPIQGLHGRVGRVFIYTASQKDFLSSTLRLTKPAFILPALPARSVTLLVTNN